jgi:site-specific recombinase
MKKKKIIVVNLDLKKSFAQLRTHFQKTIQKMVINMVEKTTATKSPGCFAVGLPK